jgi:hypothetical protein
MAKSAILAASALLLLAYVLDIVGRRLRLPAVVLLTALAHRGRAPASAPAPIPLPDAATPTGETPAR